jgi:hypothetical protein
VPASLVHHSDRGVQYCSGEYVEILRSHGIRISMSRSGNPYDNALAERLMRTLKCEEVYLNDYRIEPTPRVTSGTFLSRSTTAGVYTPLLAIPLRWPTKRLAWQVRPFSGTNGISLNEYRVHTGADPRQSVSSLDAQQTSSNEAQDASLALGEIPSVPEKRTRKAQSLFRPETPNLKSSSLAVSRFWAISSAVTPAHRPLLPRENRLLAHLGGTNGASLVLLQRDSVEVSLHGQPAVGVHGRIGTRSEDYFTRRVNFRKHI